MFAEGQLVGPRLLTDVQVFIISRVVSNRYFPVGIGRYFLVFTISIPKEISVGTFRYVFLAGDPISLKKGAMAPFLRKKGAIAPFLIQPAPLLRKKGVPAKLVIPTGNTDRQINLIPAKYHRKNCW
jgi:hypothetical protein